MAAKPRSQGSGQPMPAFIRPLLLTPQAAPPEGAGWVHELKFDGYRTQVRVEAGRVRISTREGHDWTAKFRALEALAGELPDCILDGELCALDDDGQPDFDALRSAIATGDTDSLVYFAFDALFEGKDHDLRPYPLTTRKARLRHILEEGGEHITDQIRRVDPIEGPPRQLLAAACAMKLEGIVSKRLDAPYKSERQATWIKSVCRPAIEVVIAGWTADGARFDRVLCGLPSAGGGLRYIGSLAPPRSPGLARQLAGLEVTASPFTAGPVPRKTDQVHWARPELVADVEIREFTSSGKMRHGVFKRLRPDKSAADVDASSI